jgi:hypothetical protein
VLHTAAPDAAALAHVPGSSHSPSLAYEQLSDWAFALPASRHPSAWCTCAQCHARGSVSGCGTDRSIRVSSTSRRARFSYYCTDDMHMHIAGKLCRSHLLVRVAAVLRYACTFWRWAKGRAVEHGGLGGGRATMQVGRTQRTSNAAHTRPENAVIVAEIVLRAAVPGGEHRATDRPTRATVPDSLRAVARSQNRFGRRLRRRLRNCIPRGRQGDGISGRPQIQIYISICPFLAIINCPGLPFPCRWPCCC